MSCKPTCEKRGGHDTYIIENRSIRKIEYKIMNYFSDTIIPVEYNALTDDGGVIQPDATDYSWVKLRKGECLEDLYENGIKNWIYFFDADSLQVIPWDTVCITGRGVLERRIIDLKYLQSNGFKITYE